MQVTLTFLGSLRAQVGSPTMSLEIAEEGTYRDVLDSIEETMRTRLESSLWDRDRRAFSRRIMVLLNGTSDLRDEGTVLSQGDEIVIVLPLAGG